MLITLPFFSGDSWLALKNLDFAIELDGRVDFDCLLVSDTQCDMTQVESKAAQYFRKIHKFQYDAPQIRTWPVPQNNAFCQTSRYITQFKCPWFWWETDSVPVKPGWLTAIWEEYKRGKKPFGGHWNYGDKIFNGVAVYPSMVAAYSQKAAIADLLELLPGAPQPQPPWDFYCSEEVFPKLHIMNNIMQHLWDMDGKSVTFPDQISVGRLLRPEVVLFHRSKDGTLIDRLRERKAKPEDIPIVAPSVSIDTVHGQSQMAKATTHIFVVTYYKDAEWLKCCLKSIFKFGVGFDGVTVAYPKRDRDIIRPICVTFGAIAREFEEIEGKGHLHQNAIKCMADIFCPSADFILHTDCDCLFDQPLVPADYFQDSKPVLLIEDFERMKPVGNEATGYLWKAPTEKALGMKCQYETMRRHPAVHYRATYQAMRKHVETIHGTSFIDYVMAQNPKFPYGFCEFCALGCYAHHFMYGKYYWIDVGTQERPKDKLVQLWSHGGMEMVRNQPPHTGMRQGDIVKAILR